ncbi:MAG: nucleotidyltransferase [Chthoniobacteraceae bacterium]
MIELVRAAAELQEFCEARRWRFCFIGGLAVQMWSELRTTMDVDMTLLTGFGEERPFIDALLAAYEARIPNAADHAEMSRVLLLKTREGLGIDIALGGLAFEERVIERSQKVEMMPGYSIRVCTAEDLIVFKVFAARMKDWNDVEKTIVRQGDEKLDWHYIHEQLAPLLELKAQPGLLDELATLRRRLREA